MATSYIMEGFPPLAILMTQMIVQFVFFPYSLNGEPCADAFVSERINVCQDNFHHFNTALAFVIKYICAVEKKDRYHSYHQS